MTSTPAHRAHFKFTLKIDTETRTEAANSMRKTIAKRGVRVASMLLASMLNYRVSHHRLQNKTVSPSSCCAEIYRLYKQILPKLQRVPATGVGIEVVCELSEGIAFLFHQHFAL